MDLNGAGADKRYTPDQRHPLAAAGRSRGRPFHVCFIFRFKANYERCRRNVRTLGQRGRCSDVVEFLFPASIGLSGHNLRIFLIRRVVGRQRRNEMAAVRQYVPVRSLLVPPGFARYPTTSASLSLVLLVCPTRPFVRVATDAN